MGLAHCKTWLDNLNTLYSFHSFISAQTKVLHMFTTINFKGIDKIKIGFTVVYIIIFLCDKNEVLVKYLI